MLCKIADAQTALGKLTRRSVRASHEALLLVVCMQYGVFSMPHVAQAKSNWDHFENRLLRLTWVAYSPSKGNPDLKIATTESAISADLTVLGKARFDGLVTYGGRWTLGSRLPELAARHGFQGIILGVWDPTDEQELITAIKTARSNLVLGTCVGNEGYPLRYSMNALQTAIERLRTATGKPVTTSEEIADYIDYPEIRRIGDWVFPNVHSYFYLRGTYPHRVTPERALNWTCDAFDTLQSDCSQFIMFKEVGLPTAGEATLSEWTQEQFYVGLARTRVPFVYFEAFDQVWKNDNPVEPHWGLFDADRKPKRFAKRLMQGHSQWKFTVGYSEMLFATLIFALVVFAAIARAKRCGRLL